MTNWNKRLTELRAKYGEKPLTNKELFESKEYRDFTQKAAEDMVNGICGYLRRQGFHITEAQEDERVRSIKMDIHYAEDDMTTAFTDGAHIGINAGNKMLAPLKKQELRHFAVQGFRVHELGHVIFSDFPTGQERRRDGDRRRNRRIPQCCRKRVRQRFSGRFGYGEDAAAACGSREAALAALITSIFRHRGGSTWAALFFAEKVLQFCAKSLD